MTALEVRRSRQRLDPDRSRVVLQLFVPGHEGFGPEGSRVQVVTARLLALDEGEVQHALADVLARFGDRHRDLEGTLRLHARVLTDRLAAGPPLSEDRLLLLGATFTSEHALEGAAVCNPSVVAHPDQHDLPPGALRIVLSVREVGEGHRSALGFRTGTVDAAGEVHVDPPPRWSTTGETVPGTLRAAPLRAQLARVGEVGEVLDAVLLGLGSRFPADALDAGLARVREHPGMWMDGEASIAAITDVVRRSYTVRFPEATALAERVLRPATAAEAHGIEDARMVRVVEDDGSSAVHATYTAYDGQGISQQLLRTTDFRTFTSDPLVGAGAADKGLALFPRRIGGRYAALSRADRERNAVTLSDDLRIWPAGRAIQVPARSWELLQLGNCGAPIETDSGWLVLTHALGPMRTYRIGAMLLDLDDPTVVLGQLRDPLLEPVPAEQDGYVPNVVYSCGALVHAGVLILPYGIGDAAIGLATTPVAPLVEALLAAGP